MDHNVERRYFIERTADYVRLLDGQVSDVHVVADEHRVVFRINGRPFEALAMIDAEHDLICITTRTGEPPAERFEQAVSILQNALQICWDHCVSVSPMEGRFDLSMALFIGGYSFEALEAVVFNLLGCAEAIEESYKLNKTESSDVAP